MDVKLRIQRDQIHNPAAVCGSTTPLPNLQASASLRPRHACKSKLSMASSNGHTPQEESRALQHAGTAKIQYFFTPFSRRKGGHYVQQFTALLVIVIVTLNDD